MTKLPIYVKTLQKSSPEPAGRFPRILAFFGPSETITAFDLKVGRYRQLIEFKKGCGYLRSRSCLDLGPRPFMYEN